jgi:hypothetical protein
LPPILLFRTENLEQLILQVIAERPFLAIQPVRIYPSVQGLNLSENRFLVPPSFPASVSIPTLQMLTQASAHKLPPIHNIPSSDPGGKGGPDHVHGWLEP